jgi:hypothetical protein
MAGGGYGARMTDSLDPIEQADPAPAAVKRTRWPLFAGAAVGIAAVAAAMTAFVVGGSPIPVAAPSVSPSPAVFRVIGAITLSGTDDHTGLFAEHCAGKRGYDDIRGGAQVVVSADGKTLAVGSLDPGVMISMDCRLTFTIKDVPGGLPFYGIEVSHRGELKYTQQQLDGLIELTLGN